MYGRSNFCIGKNVMFCMRRYKCNVEMVFSGTCSRVTSASSALGILNDYALYTSTHSLTHSLTHINNIIESDFIRSTDCMHVALTKSAVWDYNGSGQCVIIAYMVFAWSYRQVCLVFVFSAAFTAFIVLTVCLSVCRVTCLQWFDAVGWAAGRASGL